MFLLVSRVQRIIVRGMLHEPCTIILCTRCLQIPQISPLARTGQSRKARERSQLHHILFSIFLARHLAEHYPGDYIECLHTTRTGNAIVDADAFLACDDDIRRTPVASARSPTVHSPCPCNNWSSPKHSG